MQLYSELSKIENPIAGADIFPVTPWQKFVPALNAIVFRAVQAGYSHLLLASSTVSVTKEMVETLSGYMDSHTLVVGAALEGHNFSETRFIFTANGKETPWNTLALWNLKYLSITGFLLAGDSPWNTDNAGVEELTTISALQNLYRVNAKLINVPGVIWDTSNWDDDRKAMHDKKMATKISRPESQLGFSSLHPPYVNHIRLT